jgi:hypothetical protein
MPPAADQKSTQQSSTVPFKRNAPETVREARIGSVFIRLKKWENGEHSLELSQADRKMKHPDGKAVYHQISFGEFEATGVADAIAALTSIARK